MSRITWPLVRGSDQSADFGALGLGGPSWSPLRTVTGMYCSASGRLVPRPAFSLQTLTAEATGATIKPRWLATLGGVPTIGGTSTAVAATESAATEVFSFTGLGANAWRSELQTAAVRNLPMFNRATNVPVAPGRSTANGVTCAVLGSLLAVSWSDGLSTGGTGVSGTTTAVQIFQLSNTDSSYKLVSQNAWLNRRYISVAADTINNRFIVVNADATGIFADAFAAATGVWSQLNAGAAIGAAVTTLAGLDTCFSAAGSALIVGIAHSVGCDVRRITVAGGTFTQQSTMTRGAVAMNGVAVACAPNTAFGWVAYSQPLSMITVDGYDPTTTLAAVAGVYAPGISQAATRPWFALAANPDTGTTATVAFSDGITTTRGVEVVTVGNTALSGVAVTTHLAATLAAGLLQYPKASGTACLFGEVYGELDSELAGAFASPSKLGQSLLIVNCDAALTSAGQVEHETGRFEVTNAETPVNCGVQAKPCWAGTTPVRAFFPWLGLGPNGLRQVRVVDLDARLTPDVRTLELPGELFISGSAVTVWDGSKAYESGWHGRPILETPSFTTGGSLNPSAGQPYFYTAAVWHAIDAFGRTTYSAPTRVKQVRITPSSNSAIVQSVAQPLTKRRRLTSANPGEPRRGANWTYFRTIASNQNDTYESMVGASGSVLYNANPPTAQRYTYSVTAAPRTTTSDSIIATQADSAIQGIGSLDAALNATTLYSFGGLEYQAPLSARGLVFADNRLLLWGLPDPTQFQVSLPLKLGEPVQFCGSGSALYGNFFGAAPGAITAAFALDDQFYISTANKLFVLPGTGPSRSGAGAYDALRELPGWGGITLPDSVVVTPAGALANVRGRMLMLRRGSASPEWVGQQVRHLTTLNGGFYDPARAEVLYGAQSGGISAAYDLRSQTWVESVVPCPGVSVWSPYTFVSDGSAVWAFGLNEDTATLEVRKQQTLFSANGATVTYGFTTHDLSADVLGWQSVQKIGLAGTYLGGSGTSTVTIDVSYDGGLTFVATDATAIPLGAADTSSTYTPAVGNRFYVYATPTQQACSQIRVRVTVSSPSGSNGLELSALSLDITPASGARNRARGVDG